MALVVPGMACMDILQALVHVWHASEQNWLLSAGASIIDDALGMSEAAPPPQLPRPTLLTPKFLARAKLQPKMHTATSKASTYPNMVQTYTSLFPV